MRIFGEKKKKEIFYQSRDEKTKTCFDASPHFLNFEIKKKKRNEISSTNLFLFLLIYLST